MLFQFSVLCVLFLLSIFCFFPSSPFCFIFSSPLLLLLSNFPLLIFLLMLLSLQCFFSISSLRFLPSPHPLSPRLLLHGSILDKGRLWCPSHLAIACFQSRWNDHQPDIRAANSGSLNVHRTLSTGDAHCGSVGDCGYGCDCVGGAGGVGLGHCGEDYACVSGFFVARVRTGVVGCTIA